MAARLEKTSGRAAAVLATATQKGPRIVAAVGPGLVPLVSARRLLQDAGPLIKGGVGGKDGLATAGGSDAGGLDQALTRIPEQLATLLRP